MNKLKVVKLDFLRVEEMTYMELFEGFDKLYAITYSSSLSFISSIIDSFLNTEIIFGYRDIVPGNIEAIIANQVLECEYIKNNANSKKLIDLINLNKLKLYLPKEKVSHEKIYILEGKNNKNRIIIGSANMSNVAFGGEQREHIAIIDNNKEALHYYKELFNSFKLSCNKELTEDIIINTDETKGLLNSPICKEIKEKDCIIIKETDERPIEYEYITNITELEKDYKKHLSKPKKDKDGKTKISFKAIAKFKKKYEEIKFKENEKQKVLPQLEINLKQNKTSFNNENYDLNPSEEEVKKDIKLLIEYIEGLNNFIGDVKESKSQYFKVLNYMFMSPFISKIRHTAERHGLDSVMYPAYLVLYGDSNAGKTALIKTIEKMMLGDILPVNSSDLFTPTKINGLKQNMKGVPIVIDDLDNKRFSEYSGEIIKNSYFDTNSKFIQYPSVVITSNNVKSVKAEISKRVLLCPVNAKISREQQVLNSKIVKKVQSEIGSALYRKYLYYFVPYVKTILNRIKDDENTKSVDLFEASSIVLLKVFKEYYDSEIPHYIKKITWIDNLGDKASSLQAIKKVLDEWEYNREAFTVNKKKNVLEIRFEQNYLAQRLYDELPATLDAKITGLIVSMNLEEARNLFGISFKKEVLNIKKIDLKNSFIYKKQIKDNQKREA